MIRRLITEHVGYPLQDAVRGTSIMGTWKTLRDTQYWNRERLEEYRLAKLRKLVRHAGETVPYYADVFKRVGLEPGDIASVDDLGKIPVLTKEEARTNNDALVSRGAPIGKVCRGKTGGTTGPPLKTVKCATTRSFAWGAYFRWYDWMGIRPGDATLRFWGVPSVLNYTLRQKMEKGAIDLLRNEVTVNSFNMHAGNLDDVIRKLKSHKPKLVKGYLSAMLQVAEYIEDHRPRGVSPVAISSTTETLLPPYRAYLENVFGCGIFDQYGCGECEGIAFECGRHEGMHVTQEHVILETLDASGGPVTDEPGSIVVTDLDNYAMPMIRFRNDDTGILAGSPCSCGRVHPLLKEVSGRSADAAVLANGSRVHGVFFTDILYDLDPDSNRLIRKFQVVQDKEGDIEFRLELRQDLPAGFRESLTAGLQRHFNKVVVRVVDRLEYDASGKFRYVISRIGQVH